MARPVPPRLEGTTHRHRDRKVQTEELLERAAHGALAGDGLTRCGHEDDVGQVQRHQAVEVAGVEPVGEGEVELVE